MQRGTRRWHFTRPPPPIHHAATLPSQRTLCCFFSHPPPFHWGECRQACPCFAPCGRHGVMYPCKPAGTHGHCGPQGEPDSVLFAPPGRTHVGPRGNQTRFCSRPLDAPTRADRARQQKLNPVRRDLLSNSTFDMCAFAWDMRLHVMQRIPRVISPPNSRDPKGHVNKGPGRTCRHAIGRNGLLTHVHYTRMHACTQTHTHACVLAYMYKLRLITAVIHSCIYFTRQPPTVKLQMSPSVLKLDLPAVV